MIVLPFVSFGQKEELYYYTGKDESLVGVKSSNGKIVIPPTSGMLYAIPNEKVTGREIFVRDTSVKTHDSLAYEYGMKILDRTGKFLYSPFWFDNGPDYYVEGLRRFVEKGKMGFVDRKGKKVIPAKYNYIDFFYRGYALACLDCKYKKFREDKEHCCGYAGSKYAIIDREGKVVNNFTGSNGVELTDSLLTALKLLHPNTPKEKALIHKLEELTEVKRFMRHNPDNFCVVVAEKPKNPNGSYMIVFRVTNSAYDGDGLSFLISGNGKTILHVDNWGEEARLSDWRKSK